MARQAMDLDGLQESLWAFAGQRVLTTAARVGLLRLLAERACSPADAARELGLDALATGKVLRALSAMGIVTWANDQCRIVPSLVPHLSSGDGDVSPLIAHLHHLYERWAVTLEPWLRGEEPPAPGPADPAGFGAAMSAMGRQVAKSLVAHIDLSAHRRLLEVGGGFGHYSEAFCERQPALQATVVDREETVSLAQQRLDGTGLADRIRFVGGDYHDCAFGEGYDLALLANILHQELPDAAAALLARTAASLAPGGTLAIVEFAIDDLQREHLIGSLFAINMRSFGDTWPEPVLRRWLAEAGLDSVERIDLSPQRWLITARKPA